MSVNYKPAAVMRLLWLGANSADVTREGMAREEGRRWREGLEPGS